MIHCRITGILTNVGKSYLSIDRVISAIQVRPMRLSLSWLNGRLAMHHDEFF
jgi:hypothetical protein